MFCVQRHNNIVEILDMYSMYMETRLAGAAASLENRVCVHSDAIKIC